MKVTTRVKKTIPLYVPNIGDSNKIKIIKWYIQEGDTFKENDELCDMVSDKATFSLEAPSSGKLLHILKKNNSVVSIKEQVAIAEIYE